MGVCIRAILSLEAHNSGGRSCLLSEEETIQPLEIGQGRGIVSSFLEGGKRVMESEGGGGVRLGRESLVFKAAARLRVALPLEEPVIMFSIRSPLPGGG